MSVSDCLVEFPAQASIAESTDAFGCAMQNWFQAKRNEVDDATSSSAAAPVDSTAAAGADPASPAPDACVSDAMDGMETDHAAWAAAGAAADDAPSEAAEPAPGTDEAASDAAAPAEAAADSGPSDAVRSLMDLGFPEEWCDAALHRCRGDASLAANFIFEHMDDMPRVVEGVRQQREAAAAAAAAQEAAAQRRSRLRAGDPGSEPRPGAGLSAAQQLLAGIGGAQGIDPNMMLRMLLSQVRLILFCLAFFFSFFFFF